MQLVRNTGGVRPYDADQAPLIRAMNPGDTQAAKALLEPYHVMLAAEALSPAIDPGLAP